ncbi:neuroglobin-like [Littorina saxatilis]|uniref:Globin n=1 Tax=Littorina saxatilis TaxID=31220 RepID=A0AAN9GH90_9CAEN
MGCEFGKPQVVTVKEEEPEGDITGFSETQIDTIRSTWPLLSCQNTRVGVEVFSRIFREAPTIHALFHNFNINKVDDLHHSKVFKEHAGRFMGVIQDLVDHLETPTDVDQHLLILGAKHATFDGYHPEYFRFYTKCMMEVWEMELGEEFIHEVRDSWRLAFDYIVERMTEGFDMCLSGQIQDVINSSTTPSTSLKGWHGQGQRQGQGQGQEEGVVVSQENGGGGGGSNGGGRPGRQGHDTDDGLAKVQ